MLADGEVFAQVAESIKAKDKTLWQTIKDFFTNLAAKIKSAYAKLEPDSIEGRYVADMLDTAEELKTLWAEALVEASGVQKESLVNNDTAEPKTPDIKFSERYQADEELFNPEGKTLDEQLDNILHSAESFDGRYLYIGRFTSDFIEMVKKYVNIDDLPIAMNYRDAYLSMESNDNGKYKGDGINYHNLGKQGLKNAIESFSNPTQVLLSPKNGKIELVLESVDKKGNKLLSIVALNTTARNAKKYIEAHIVTSIYGKRSIDRYVSKAEQEGRLIYNKNEELTQVNSQVQYEGIINANSSIDRISQNSDSVNSSDKKLYSDRYSYESLISKPNMKITTVGGNVPKNRADVVAQAKKNAVKVGKFNLADGSVSVHIDDIGKDVVVSTGGLRHGLDRRFDVNAPVTVKAGEILKNSIRINEMTPDNDNAESSYALIGAAKNEKGELYIVRSIVNSFKSELVSMDTLYAINAKTEPNLGIKKGNQVGAYPQGTPSNDSFLTDSTISISQLLDFVNRYFPDILPESVLRHYGYDARPEGELGESALYSDRNPDAIPNRALLANALESVAQNDIERSKLNEYKKKISLIESEQAKLSELNGKIKELSFAKGKRDTEAIKKLQLEANQTANRINTYDRQLLNLEATAALKGVLNREKQAAYKRATDYDISKTNRDTANRINGFERPKPKRDTLWKTVSLLKVYHKKLNLSTF